MTLAALTALQGCETANIHGSCVAIGGRAVLCVGRSGTGKSALALELMGLGATLVADDRVDLSVTKTGLCVSPPAPIAGLIEARGMGILRAEYVDSAGLVAVVDMDQVETERLPHLREVSIMEQRVSLFCRVAAPHFSVALLQFLKMGWGDPGRGMS